MTSDDLLSWLHPFCGDAALPVRPRIDVLQILESNFSLRDSDVRLLLLYRTQAVLKDREVSVQTQFKRCHFDSASSHHRILKSTLLPKQVCTVKDFSLSLLMHRGRMRSFKRKEGFEKALDGFF